MHHRIHELDHFGNQAANSHPHIHCLVTDGLSLSDGSFLSTAFISPVDITELFRRVVLEAFVAKELITQDVAQNMLSWPHSGFNIHIGPRLMADDGDAIQTTARYAARAPISLSRLHYDRKSQSVTYHYTSAYDHQDKIERLSPRKMIARLATHIPDHNERLIRYSGVYANRAHKPGRSKTPSVEGETTTEPPC